QRNEEEQYPETDSRTNLCVPRSNQKQGRHQSESKPRIPICKPGDRNGIEIVIARNLGRRYEQAEILQKNAARGHPSLNQRQRSIEILPRGRNSQTAKDVEAQSQISNPGCSQYCKSPPGFDNPPDSSSTQRDLKHGDR